MNKNENLKKAKSAKNDEFYTRLEDIQNELNRIDYIKAFEGKTILCNCDDCFESNFVKFFLMNFRTLKLKRFISTSYDESPMAYTQLSFFDGEDKIIKETKKAYVLDITEKDMPDSKGTEFWKDIKDLVKTKAKLLKGNGSFNSDECIEYLKQADVVVTNPPFSLFREFVATMEKYEKKFIVWSNNNAITYKEFFPLLKDNKVWLGYTTNKTIEFIMPDSYKLTGKAYIDDHGLKHGFVPAISVFTNIDINKRHENLLLTCKYNKYENEYPKYDNYDAININKVSEIPMDYEGVMGVPITFMDKFNPEQFEIVGLAPERLSENESSLQIKRYKNAVQYKANGETCSGNKVNDGPTLLHHTKPSKFPYYTSETVEGEFLEVLYARILIKNRHPVYLDEDNETVVLPDGSYKLKY